MPRLLLLLKAALRSIARNTMRSALTVLGIVIGVGAVIAMVGIGEGASNLVQSQISALGDNLINVFPGSFAGGGRHFGAGSSSTLTEEDAAAIEQQVPLVTMLSPVAQSGGMVVYGNENWSTSFLGGDSDYFDIRKWPVVEGTGFGASAVRSTAKVAVLGRTVAEQLFQGADPVGQIVRIKKMPFTVIGVLEEKGQNSWGRDQDDVIILPYTTVMKRLSGQTKLSMILASATSADDLDEAVSEISALLRQRHRLPAGVDDDFTVRTQQDIASVMGSTSRVMRILLAAIASVSLLVGGIGIMNIMLVSVTERTKEIGIRKAVGAKHSAIMAQFLFEAIALSVVGGIIGMALGFGVAALVNAVSPVPAQVRWWSVALGIGFSAAVGIFFGYFPAKSAAAKDPIECLRYE